MVELTPTRSPIPDELLLAYLLRVDNLGFTPKYQAEEDVFFDEAFMVFPQISKILGKTDIITMEEIVIAATGIVGFEEGVIQTDTSKVHPEVQRLLKQRPALARMIRNHFKNILGPKEGHSLMKEILESLEKSA